MMEYYKLMKDVVGKVRVRYDDYVKYQESKFITVDSFDEVAEQLLDEVLDDYLIYEEDMATIFTATCDNIGEVLLGYTPHIVGGDNAYDAFRSDCAEALDIK